MLGVALNLAVLGLFKYADFFRGTVFGLLGEDWHPWNLILPLGISFFVFQKISYLIDLRRGDRHIYGFLDFCMFVMFFPQLIAGPLVRHNEIIHQFDLDPRRAEMWENLSRGFVLFIIGVAKKVALADTLAMAADPLFAKALGTPLSAAEAWTAAGAYTLQIYFDFSGYSDMAIGLALMFGLRIPFNFNAPYRAAVGARFLAPLAHDAEPLPARLSLHSAGRQPLRSGRARRRTWSRPCCSAGLWHGANWTFVAWGGLHGVALAVNHVWETRGLCLPRPTLPGSDAAVRDRRLGAVPLAGFQPCRAGDGQHGGPARAWAHRARSRIRPGAGVGAAVATLGPTSQEAALRWLRPETWLAVPAGVALAYLLLLVGGRLPNVFIYFQF